MDVPYFNDTIMAAELDLIMEVVVGNTDIQHT